MPKEIQSLVQIIQINLVLKNGAFDTPEKQFVQIIQINLVLKNMPSIVIHSRKVQIIQINLVLKNKDRRSQILDEFK